MGQRWFRVVVLIMITVLVLDAARWSNGCWDQERIALLQLKSFFNDNKGEEGLDCCQWTWVDCNITTKRVTLIFLYFRLDSDLINASLFLPFEELRSLYLIGNPLVGCVENEGFEKLSKLRHLETLDLSANRFNDSILSSLGGLSSLRTLSLAENNFEGIFHLEDLYNLTNLKELDLSWNQIESLQSSPGNGRQLGLTKLEEIELSFNLFNNNILTELSGFSNLKSLYIRQNQLNGSIDVKEFCGWSNLESLDLSYNEVNQFVNLKEKRCLRKLKFLCLDGVPAKGNVSLVSFLNSFPSVKTLFLRENSFLNKTVVTQELQVLSNVENLILDSTPLHISFLESIGILTSLKTLSLYNCNLAGILPTRGWCYLKSLEELNLLGNALGGPIPSCLGNLTSLRYLDISHNQFSGNITSTPLINLTKLQLLSFSENQFQVPVSFKLFTNHSNLKFLSCGANNLVVEPATFQTWTPKFQLRAFILSNCKIDEQGKLQLPNFLYFQYDLRYIDLSYCNFGEIWFPDWLLENNRRLKAIYMIDSSIVGPLFLPSHPNSNLVEFDISNNKMQSEIPRNFCSLFPNLENLNMSRNAFKSNIPLCLGGLRKLSILDLSHNKFFGAIPEELTMSNSLSLLRLSNNTLSGKIFPAIYYLTNSLANLYLDGNKFEGEIPDFSPIRSGGFKRLDVSDNHLSGKLPRWFWNMTNLLALDLSKNHFEGPIPVELCNLVNLQFLDLSQNNLSGTIPSCSNLPNIVHVHLGKNKLSGTISHAFYGSSSLVTLDLRENNLTGRIPNWIGTLLALSVLLLKANHFHGGFPIHLCNLYSLSILDLSQNELSGPIPACLSNLSLTPRSEKSDTTVFFSTLYSTYYFFDVLEDVRLTMFDLKSKKDYFDSGLPDGYTYSSDFVQEKTEVSTKNAAYTYKGIILDLLSVIDLSCNQLTGIIPPGLGNLSEIHGLNLSHNNLTGPIPSTFTKFKQIESLDLSYNNLNGRIPPQLTVLTTLEVFTVAHNNLSGSLPDRKAQFLTFDESSYEGNPFLCGLPLKNRCDEVDSVGNPSASSSEEEHGLIDMGDFYISFAVSYAIILLATVIVLYINPYWRRAWFYFVEEHSIACYYFIVDRIRRLPFFRRNM